MDIHTEAWLEDRAEQYHEEGLDWKDACIQAKEDLENGNYEMPDYEPEDIGEDWREI
jgi:hypothetical protein